MQVQTIHVAQKSFVNFEYMRDTRIPMQAIQCVLAAIVLCVFKKKRKKNAFAVFDLAMNFVRANGAGVTFIHDEYE